LLCALRSNCSSDGGISGSCFCIAFLVATGGRRRRRRRRKRRRMVQNGKLLVRVMRCKIGLSPRIKTQIGHTRVRKRQVQVPLFLKALHYGIFSVLSVGTSGDFTSCCLSFYFAIGFFLPTRFAGALCHAHKGQIQ